jgi:hypothetical protein
MRSDSFWTCLAVLALTGAVRAEDTYTIKLKHGPDVGKTVTVKYTETVTHSDKVTDPDGKVIEDGKKHTITFEDVYTETVLEKGGKVPNKFKRTHEKATRTVDGKTETRSYQGRTLVFEKKDGKFAVTPEGDKPLSKEDLEGLTRKANDNSGGGLEDALLPAKPVKVGDAWKIEGKRIAEAFPDLDPDVEKSAGEGKLTKVYQKDGHQFGTIVLTVKVQVTKVPKGGVTFDKPPVLELKLTADAVIDGSSAAGVVTATASTATKGTNEVMGKKLTFESFFEFSARLERSVEK